MVGRCVPLALALLVVTGPLAGCTGSTERSEVQRIAVDFVTAIEDHDGTGACALLTSDAEQSASGATDVTCASAVLSIDESGAEVRHIQIWGDAAQVKLGSDTVFLQKLPDGWRVRAAGCRSRPAASYNCDIEG